MKLLLFVLLAVVPVFSQSLHFGIKGGVPFTDAFDIAVGSGPNVTSETQPFTVGPMVDLELPFGLGIEFNALYKRFEYSRAGLSVNSEGSSWEFPLLLKLRSPGILIRPYAAAGVSFNRLAGLARVGEVAGIPGVTASDTKLRTGFVLGGGIEFRVPFVRISPEIRYTRWRSETIENGLSAVLAGQNQAEFLVGFTF
ncbi:MAG: outer membrane beta-barrel protein [Bryobacteraceae bacterium]